MASVADNRVKENLQAWRKTQWPPQPPLAQCFEKMPIYHGTYEQVMEFGESLAGAMGPAASHVTDKCRGTVPRWMAVPKVVFGVRRIALAQSTAKASKRFESLDSIVQKFGQLKSDDARALFKWMANNPGGHFVAHKPFTDLRAYVYVEGESGPRRVRFYESGLVVASASETVLLKQDHREVVRESRSDALVAPVVELKGWSLFGRPHTA